MEQTPWTASIQQCISKEVSRSRATGSYHTGGIPFDTGALMNSIYLT